VASPEVYSKLNGAGEPAGGEAQRDHNKDDIQDEHDPAHGLGHLPLEGEDGEEDQHEHEEEHADVAAHAFKKGLSFLLRFYSV
jgi:hypothetical protein